MSELNLDESALEAAMVADSKCQQESCNVQECNGFFCHRALAAYIARSPSRNDVLEEAAKELIKLHRGPHDLKRPDVYERLFTRIERALKDRDR